jgi:hypothetical protein
MQIKVLTKLTEMAEILPGGGRWNRQRSALLTSVARQRRNRLPALGSAGRQQQPHITEDKLENVHGRRHDWKLERCALDGKKIEQGTGWHAHVLATANGATELRWTKIDLHEEGYPSRGHAAIQQQIVTAASRYRT